METGDYISGRADMHEVIRKRIQLWSVNQRTIEAEEVTDS
jgi:hypothetical protein